MLNLLRKTTRIFFTFSTLLLFINGCTTSNNDVGTSVPNPPSSTPVKTASILVASIFHSSESAIHAGVAKFHTAEAPTCTTSMAECYCVGLVEQFNSIHGGENINISSQGNGGTFGSKTNSVTLNDSNYCVLADGNNNLNVTAGGENPYVGFEIEADFSGNCRSEANEEKFILKKSSSGVIRIELDEHGQADYRLIFGHFIFEKNSASVAMNCSIITDIPDGQILSANCTDSTDKVVTQDGEATCSIL